jgi:hypothetical protein
LNKYTQIAQILTAYKETNTFLCQVQKNFYFVFFFGNKNFKKVLDFIKKQEIQETKETNKIFFKHIFSVDFF